MENTIEKLKAWKQFDEFKEYSHVVKANISDSAYKEGEIYHVHFVKLWNNRYGVYKTTFHYRERTSGYRVYDTLSELKKRLHPSNNIIMEVTHRKLEVVENGSAQKPIKFEKYPIETVLRLTIISYMVVSALLLGGLIYVGTQF